jgi:hypothetical protein
MTICIKLIHNTVREREIKKHLLSFIKHFDIPIFCNHVSINENIKVSHSHPQITIAPYRSKFKLLETYTHEQFHHFEEKKLPTDKSHPYYKYIKNNLKTVINLTKDEFVDRGYDPLINFGQHLCVCFNTWNIIRHLTKQWHELFLKNNSHPNPQYNSPHKKLEQYIFSHWNKIHDILDQFGLIYTLDINLSKSEHQYYKTQLKQKKSIWIINSDKNHIYTVGNHYDSPLGCLECARVVGVMRVKAPNKKMWWNMIPPQAQKHIMSSNVKNVEHVEYVEFKKSNRPNCIIKK